LRKERERLEIAPRRATARFRDGAYPSRKSIAQAVRENNRKTVPKILTPIPRLKFGSFLPSLDERGLRGGKTQHDGAFLFPLTPA
jgi:hypothetical protein